MANLLWTREDTVQALPTFVLKVFERVMIGLISNKISKLGFFYITVVSPIQDLLPKPKGREANKWMLSPVTLSHLSGINSRGLLKIFSFLDVVQWWRIIIVYKERYTFAILLWTARIQNAYLFWYVVSINGDVSVHDSHIHCNCGIQPEKKHSVRENLIKRSQH